MARAFSDLVVKMLSAKSRFMRVRQISSLILLAVLGCGPLKTVTDIYSGDSPGKGSSRTISRFSTGDPSKLDTIPHHAQENAELSY
jgi:hypothetical protein